MAIEARNGSTARAFIPCRSDQMSRHCRYDIWIKQIGVFLSKDALQLLKLRPGERLQLLFAESNRYSSDAELRRPEH